MKCTLYLEVKLPNESAIRLLVCCSVCHNFLKGQGSYTYIQNLYQKYYGSHTENTLNKKNVDTNCPLCCMKAYTGLYTNITITTITDIVVYRIFYGNNNFKGMILISCKIE